MHTLTYLVFALAVLLCTLPARCAPQDEVNVKQLRCTASCAPWTHLLHKGGGAGDVQIRVELV